MRYLLILVFLFILDLIGYGTAILFGAGPKFLSIFGHQIITNLILAWVLLETNWDLSMKAWVARMLEKK